MFRRLSAEPSEIDGRRGWQWKLAIEGYLWFRGGRDWRRVTDRFLPESWDYVTACNALNQAWASLDPCRCVYCVTGAPFADERRAQLSLFPEKKPVAAAHLPIAFAKKKAGAA